MQSWNSVKGSSQSQISRFWTVLQVPRPLQWISSLHTKTRKNAFELICQKNNILFNYYRFVTCTIQFFIPTWITITSSIITDAFVVAIDITWTVKHYKNDRTYNQLFNLLNLWFPHRLKNHKKWGSLVLHKANSLDGLFFIIRVMLF